MNPIGITDWTVLKHEHADGAIRFLAEYARPPASCRRCGVLNPKLCRHETKEHIFMDTPMHGRRAGPRAGHGPGTSGRLAMNCYACGKPVAPGTRPLPYQGSRRPFHPECYSKVRRVEADVSWDLVPAPAAPEPAQSKR